MHNSSINVSLLASHASVRDENTDLSCDADSNNDGTVCRSNIVAFVQDHSFSFGSCW